MDGRQFDTIVKGLARVRISRLDALRRLAASALAGVTFAGLPNLDSEAKRRGKRKRKQRRKDKRKDRKKAAYRSAKGSAAWKGGW